MLQRHAPRSDSASARRRKPREFKRFLQLKQFTRDVDEKKLQPTPLMAYMWRAAVLDTRFDDDLEEHIGMRLHHTPADFDDEGNEIEAAESLRLAFLRTLYESRYSSLPLEAVPVVQPKQEDHAYPVHVELETQEAAGHPAAAAAQLSSFELAGLAAKAAEQKPEEDAEEEAEADAAEEAEEHKEDGQDSAENEEPDGKPDDDASGGESESRASSPAPSIRSARVSSKRASKRPSKPRHIIEIALTSASRKVFSHRAYDNLPLSSIIAMYCEAVQTDSKSLRFWFGGVRVFPYSKRTPADLNMQDGDVIDVVDVDKP
jgi:hypothetical protein